MNKNLILAKKNITKAILATLVLLAVAALFLSDTKPAVAAYGLNESVKQVKIADGTAIYYLDHNLGLKKAYVSAGAFLSYGNKWGDVKTITQEELNKWPDMNLIKINNDPSVYYISEGKKYLIRSEQEFINYGFDWNEIVNINITDLNSYNLGGFVGDSGLQPKTFGGVEQLSVSLDPSSPKGDYAAINTKDNLVAVFDLKSPAKTAEIKNLTITYGGVFNRQVIKRLYLKDENDELINVPSTHSNQNNYTFSFNNKPFVIYPGSDKKIKVFADFADYEDCLNQTAQFSIRSAADIDANTIVEGNFPLQSGVFKLINANGMIGAVKTEGVAVNTGDAVVGSTDHLVGKMIISETSGIEGITVKEIALRNAGTADKWDIADFKLKDKNNRVIAQTDKMSDSNYITFKLSDYKIPADSGDTFSIYCDPTDGEMRTINLQIINVTAKGATAGLNLNSEIYNSGSVITLSRQKLGAVSLGLAKSKNVFTEQPGIIFGVFQIRNNNQTAALKSLDFRLEKNSKAPNLNNEVFYIVNYDTGEVYNSFDGVRFSQGKANIALNNVKINPKSVLNIAVISSFPYNIADNSSYKLILDSINYQLQNKFYYSDNVNVAGENLILNKANLAIFGNGGDQSYIKGQNGVKIGSFTIEASAGEDVLIKNVTFSKSGNSAIVDYNNGFSNLKAYINGTQSKTVVAKPYGGTASFDFNYKLSAGTGAEVKIYADLSKNLNANSAQLSISDISAANNKTGLPANVSGLGANSFKSSYGSTEAELIPLDKGVINAGEKNNFVAGFKVKNSGAEDITLSSIVVSTSNNAFSSSLGFANLNIIERWSGKKVGGASKPVAKSNKISLNNYTVPAGEEKIFDLYVDANDNIPREAIDVYFHDIKAGGRTSKTSFTIAGEADNSGIAVSENNSGSDNQNQEKKLNLKKPASGNVTYFFYDPKYPYKNQFKHTGIDIDVKQGTDVKASEAGTVTEVVDGGMEYCSYVVIRHSDTIKTMYAHLSKINVKTGDTVKQSQVIGKSGGTPGTAGAGQFTNGPHLHFEVLLADNPVDPMAYLR